MRYDSLGLRQVDGRKEVEGGGGGRGERGVGNDYISGLLYGLYPPGAFRKVPAVREEIDPADT